MIKTRKTHKIHEYGTDSPSIWTWNILNVNFISGIATLATTKFYYCKIQVWCGYMKKITSFSVQYIFEAI